MAEGERRAQIIQAASDLFGRRGYAAVTIGDVGEAVGVTKAALYHHFPSKAALYAAVLCHGLTMIARSIRQTADGPLTTGEKIGQMAEIAIVWLEDDADMDAMMRDAEEHLSEALLAEVAAANRDRRTALEELMRDGVVRGDLRGDVAPEFLAHAFWHLLDGFVGRRRSSVGFRGTPQLAASVTDLFLRGADSAADRAGA